MAAAEHLGRQRRRAGTPRARAAAVRGCRRLAGHRRRARRHRADAFVMGEPERSLERHRSRLPVREQLGDDRGEGLALARMGQVQRADRRLVAAEGHFRQAIELRRRAGIGGRGGFAAGAGRAGARSRRAPRPCGCSRRRGRWPASSASAFRSAASRSRWATAGCRVAEPRAARAEFLAAKEIARQFGAKCAAVGGLARAGRGGAGARRGWAGPRRGAHRVRDGRAHGSAAAGRSGAAGGGRRGGLWARRATPIWAGRARCSIAPSKS